MLSEKFLNEFPPAAIRVVAKKGNGIGIHCLTDEDISKKTGFGIWKVAKISAMDNWDEVKWGDIVKFISACGVNVDRPRGLRRYMTEGKKHQLFKGQAGNRNLKLMRICIAKKQRPKTKIARCLQV